MSKPFHVICPEYVREVWINDGKQITPGQLIKTEGKRAFNFMVDGESGTAEFLCCQKAGSVRMEISELVDLTKSKTVIVNTKDEIKAVVIKFPESMTMLGFPERMRLGVFDSTSLRDVMKNSQITECGFDITAKNWVGIFPDLNFPENTKVKVYCYDVLFEKQMSFD